MSRVRLGLVAYEYPPLIGGMATYARAVARHMCEQGYEVHVFANEQSRRDGDPRLNAEITVHPILTTDLARDLPRLARFDMDIWHAINFAYAPLAMIKRPFVLTVHGTDFLTPWVRFSMDRVPVLWRASNLLARRGVRRLMYGPALRCVDQVLTCSRFSARLFRRAYPSVGRLSVVPNGVDDSFLQPVRCDRHPRRLLTVCNLDTANRRKNVDGVLRAMALIGDRLDLEYHVVGDGALRPELEQLVRELKLGERVRFRGRLSDEDLRQAYAEASLFILAPRPQPGDVEGFGIVYLEAAAAGTPSLASRCGGAEDAIADGRSGFFVDDPSAVGIAAALERFFTGHIRFDEAGLRHHALGLAWPSVLERVEGVYRRVLPKAGRLHAGHLRDDTVMPAALGLGGL